MQLFYRGNAYQLTQRRIPTVESNTSATFLGRRYRVRQAHLPLLQSLPTEELIYRGVKYGGPRSA